MHCKKFKCDNVYSELKTKLNLYNLSYSKKIKQEYILFEEESTMGVLTNYF